MKTYIKPELSVLHCTVMYAICAGSALPSTIVVNPTDLIPGELLGD